MSVDAITLTGYVVAIVFVVLFWKSIPGAFHVRLFSACVGGLLEGRLHKLAEHVTMTDRVVLSDMDLNMHQNNSVYALIADISRYHWISRLISGNFTRLRSVKIANGGVSIFFLKEIGFLQKFSVSTFCMGMDHKWRQVSWGGNF